MPRGNGKDRYQRLVDDAFALPHWQPKPIEPDEDLISKFSVKRVKQFLLADAAEVTREAAQKLHTIVARASFGDVTLQDDVPVDKLHKAITYHTTHLMAAAVMRGRLPVQVLINDRFEAWIDFGDNRVLHLNAVLHNTGTESNAATQASYVVEERALPEHFYQSIDVSLREKSTNGSGESRQPETVEELRRRMKPHVR